MTMTLMKLLRVISVLHFLVHLVLESSFPVVHLSGLKLLFLEYWGLHVINGPCRNGHKHPRWEIHKLLRSLYWLFKNIPGGRSKFTGVTLCY